jgi:protein tyrosine/serine phosphatase
MPDMCNEKTIIKHMNHNLGNNTAHPILRNFRDVSQMVSTVKANIIFISSSLTDYQNNNIALDVLRTNQVQTVIDLRAEREVILDPYSEFFLKKFNCINIPLDPWNQPEWFIHETNTLYCNCSNAEKAYYYFIKCCQAEIKAIFETIAKSKDAVALHCVSGKDRSGLIVILLGMLVDSSYKELLSDYLVSEQDTDKKKFNIFYNHIISCGGIIEYLRNCNISQVTLNSLKLKFKR